MGLVFRKRVRLGRNTKLDVSGHGASVSEKLGPLTVNSSCRGSIRLGKGLSFRFKA